MLQPPEHLGPPLVSLQYFHGFLVPGSPELDTALQMWSHKWWIEGHNHSSQSAGYSLATTARCVAGTWLNTFSTRTPSSCLSKLPSSCLAPGLCGSTALHLLLLDLMRLWSAHLSCSGFWHPVEQNNPSTYQSLTALRKLSVGAFHSIVLVINKDIKQYSGVWALALRNPLQHGIFPSRWLNKWMS